jgi:hypothetical protein
VGLGSGVAVGCGVVVGNNGSSVAVGNAVADLVGAAVGAVRVSTKGGAVAAAAAVVAVPVTVPVAAVSSPPVWVQAVSASNNTDTAIDAVVSLKGQRPCLTGKDAGRKKSS